MVRTTFKEVLPLSSPTYADLDDIGRCVHIDDVEEAMDEGFLVPQPISNSHKRLGRKVLWFAPCQSMSSHNYYGNITFVVKWETARRKMGPNVYLLDQAIYSSRSFTRIVLTRMNHDDQLKKVDLHTRDSALTEASTGYQHVNNCLNKKEYGPHELQIAIEVDEDDARWLLHNCKVLANDHSCANTPYTGYMQRKGKFSEYESYMCFKFNTQNKECPYEFTKNKCVKSVMSIILHKIAEIDSDSISEIEEFIRKGNFAPFSTYEEALQIIFERFSTLSKHQKLTEKPPTFYAKEKTASFEIPSIKTRTVENSVTRPLNSLLTSTKLSEHSAAGKIEKPLSGESSNNANSPRFGTVYSLTENPTYSGNPTTNVQVPQHLMSVRESSDNPVNTSSKDSSSLPNENVQLRFVSAVKQEKAFSNISPTSRGSSAVSFVQETLPPNATSHLAVTAENVKTQTTSPKLLSSYYSPTPSQHFASVGLSSQRTTTLRMQASPDKDQEASSRVFLPAATQCYTATKLASQTSVSVSSRTNSTVASPVNYHSRVSDRVLGGTSSFGHDEFSQASSGKLQKRPEKLSAAVKEARVAVLVLQSASTDVPAHETVTRVSSHSVSGVPKSSNYYSSYLSSDNSASDSSPSSYDNLSLVSSPELQKLSRLRKNSTLNDATTMSSAYYRTAYNASPQISALTSKAVPHTSSAAAAISNSGNLTSLRNSARKECSLSNYGSAQPAIPRKRVSLSPEISVCYNKAEETSAERRYAKPRVSSRNAVIAADDRCSSGERASDDFSSSARKNWYSLFRSSLKNVWKAFLKNSVSPQDRPSCPSVAKHSSDFQISDANKYVSSTTPLPCNDNLTISASDTAHQTLSRSVSAAFTKTDSSRRASTDRENLSATSAAYYSTPKNASLLDLEAVSSHRSSTRDCYKNSFQGLEYYNNQVSHAQG